MPLTNSPTKFGTMTKFLHWSIFLLFCVQYYLVNRRDFFPDNAPEKLQYILLHKSLGVLVLAVAFIMLVVRHLGKRPSHTPGTPTWQIVLAKAVHLALYLVMLLMPFTGIMMSLLSGYGVSFFGVPLPNPFEANKELAGVFHSAHGMIAWVVVALVGLHVFAALYHHFKLKDNVLKRMLPFSNPD